MDFGNLHNILTEENIKTDKLYLEAKEINYTLKYDDTRSFTWTRLDVEEVIEAKWNELSGFIKGLNVACAD